jgi:hypothetical protein
MWTLNEQLPCYIHTIGMTLLNMIPVNHPEVSHCTACQFPGRWHVSSRVPARLSELAIDFVLKAVCIRSSAFQKIQILNTSQTGMWNFTQSDFEQHNWNRKGAGRARVPCFPYENGRHLKEAFAKSCKLAERISLEVRQHKMLTRIRRRFLTRETQASGIISWPRPRSPLHNQFVPSSRSTFDT